MLKPINGQVLIREIKPEERTIGNIVIPKTVLGPERTKTGEIIATGGEIVNPANGAVIPNQVKVGDKILFSIYHQELKFEGEEYFLLKENDILAIIE